MADIYNTTSNTIITGTADGDSIINYSDWLTNSGYNVTIDAREGNDTISNDCDNVSINAGDDDDLITNIGDSVTIDAGAGNDQISNSSYGTSVTIDAGDGDDWTYNDGDSVKINAGAGNDTIRNEHGDSVTIDSGVGNDSIDNYASYVTINAGDDNDRIYNSASYVTIDAGAGDDYIHNSTFYGSNVSINAGDGNDRIYNYSCTSLTISAGAGDDLVVIGSDHLNIATITSVLIYNEGDGNDTVSLESSSIQYTLQVDSSATPISLTSGSDLVVKIGEGSVTFLGMGSESLNIVDPEGNALSLVTDGSEDGKTDTDTGNTDTDTGSTDTDTGETDTDTGNTETDTGNVETDTGNTETDTGSTDTDTGETNTETVAAETVNVNLGWASGDIGVFYITDSTGADAAYAAGSFTVYNNHIYGIYSNAAETWDEADAYAKNLGGYLAVINSAAENTALYDFMTSAGYSSAYFGLTDAESEGNWRWVNGEALTYTNWASGEPNGGESENHGMFHASYIDGKWNDGSFSAGSAFIVEWNSDATIVGSVNSGTDYTAQNGIGIAQNVTVPNSWNAAATNLDDTINAAVGGNSSSIVSATVDTGEGNDLINASAIFWSTVTLEGGNGNDTVNIVGNVDGIHPSTVLIDGGAGADLISIYGGNEGIHGGTTDVSGSEKSSVSIDGGDGDDQIFIAATTRNGIDISNVKINGGAGNDLVSISGGTYGIYGDPTWGNSTVSIDGGAGADTIAVSSINSLGGVTIVAGEGDVVSVGSGEAVYFFDSTSDVTINGATFTASSVDTAASLESDGAGISIKSEWSGRHGCDFRRKFSQRYYGQRRQRRRQLQDC